MGKLNYDPYIQHFSHPHLLELFNNFVHPQPVQNIAFALCSGCKLQPSGWIYTCKPCNFNLHLSCTQMPQLINHPSHLNHSLILLPTPVYPGGLFNCDGCGRRGNGFSYHCKECDFDVHILCASKPLSISNQFHPHQLKLTFDPPYETKGFSCDICHSMGSNQWLYRCSDCEFDAHLDCVTGTLRPSAIPQPQPQLQLQHHHSFPGANQSHYQVPEAAGQANRPGQMNYYMHSQSMGGAVQQNYQQPNTNESANALAGAVVQGFVEGAAQQVGQDFVQSITSDGNGGSSSDIGDSSSPSIISIGTSILSGAFGDSNTQN